MKINDKQRYLWRAVNHESEVQESCVTCSQSLVSQCGFRTFVPSARNPACYAITEICGGHIPRAKLGSGEISLRPETVRAGDYKFSVGSVGRANLVLQTVLPVLLQADEPSSVTIQGGGDAIQAHLRLIA